MLREQETPSELLGANVFRLQEYICESLYTKGTSNFKVVCANKLLGIGPNLSDESARDISKLWGNNAVHPQPEAYEALAHTIESDILQEGIVHYHSGGSMKLNACILLLAHMVYL
jgi:hypothetical protein